MNHQKTAVVTALAIALTAGAFAAQRSPRDSVRQFMRPKLEHAQKLLEGLTLEDFDLLAAEAQALSLLSLEADWKVLQTEDYLHYSSEFRRSTEALRKAAEQKNLDGATLAYLEMATRCVRCHKYVRDVRTARNPTTTPR